MAITQLADIIVPEVFDPYMRAKTEIKSKLVQSGAVSRDPKVDAKLAGGGNTFTMPSWKHVTMTDAENISSGNTGSPTTPKSLASFSEQATRLARNQSWGATDLLESLAGEDPMDVIASELAEYWAYRMQITLLAILAGVFADNDANDAADMTYDQSGVGFVDGTTTFSAEGMIRAFGTMGDSSSGLAVIWTHSKVVERMKINNLIDFVPDSRNPDAEEVMTFHGRRVVEDDSMPADVGGAGVYHTYLLGVGSVAWGQGTPKTPIATERDESDAGGGGSETLHSRQEWCIHPRGFSYVGASTDGGPANSVLDDAASWNRVAPERKLIRIARYITREHA